MIESSLSLDQLTSIGGGGTGKSRVSNGGAIRNGVGRKVQDGRRVGGGKQANMSMHRNNSSDEHYVLFCTPQFKIINLQL